MRIKEQETCLTLQEHDDDDDDDDDDVHNNFNHNLHYGHHDKCIFIINYLLQYILMKFWCRLPENGHIISPKHLAVVSKIVLIIYRIVHLLVLCELSNLSQCTE